MDVEGRPGTGKEVATMKRFSILIACFLLIGATATDPVPQHARSTFSLIPASLPDIEYSVLPASTEETPRPRLDYSGEANQ